MGAGASREEKVLKGLPVVNKTYEVKSLLGAGEFGAVYKVLDKKQKEEKFYAMKCVPVDFPPESKVNPRQQQVVIETAKTEKKLLEILDHENVVKLYDSFVHPSDPGKKKGKKNKLRHFCMVLEYCHGSDLDEILKKMEQKDKTKQSRAFKAGSKKAKQMEVEDFTVPQDLCILWFIKLLRTLVYVHGKEIIHRDLKPDNILVCYKTLNDYKNMELKLSDFGVGKDISDNKLARDISGQLFYTAPEILRQEKAYDSRADMWSLGIIFLQVYAQMSMEKYQGVINEIFLKIKTTKALRVKFQKRFGIRDMENVKLLPLLNFMHEKDLFYVIINRFVKDAGVKEVLSKMMCPYEDRLYSKDLIDYKVVKTWDFILDRGGKMMMDKKDYSMEGIITILKIPDNILFTRCLDILKDIILTNVRAFVDNDGIRILLTKIYTLKQMWKRRYMGDVVNILMKILQDLRYEEDSTYFMKTMRSVISLFREFGHVRVLLKLMLFENNPILYYFAFLLVRYSRTIRSQFVSFMTLRQLITKMNDRNSKYILAIFEAISPFIEEKELSQFLGIFKKSNDVSFLKRCDHKRKINEIVIKKLVSEIKELADEEDDEDDDEDAEKKKKKKKGSKKLRLAMDDKPKESKKEKRISDLLVCLIFFIQDFNVSHKVHSLSLKAWDGRHPIDTRLELSKGSQERWKDVEITPKHVMCLTKDTSYIELISLTSLLTFPSHPRQSARSKRSKSSDMKEEIAIGYFEIDIEHGGINDDLYMGFRILKKYPSQVLLHCATGTVGVIDYSIHDVGQFKLAEPLYCETGSTVGCGITNYGKVFFTLNNRLIKPMIDFVSATMKLADVFVSLKFNGNFQFKGNMNFGQKPYRFQFGSVEPKIQLFKRRRNLHKNEMHKEFEIFPKSLNCLEKEDAGSFILYKVAQKYEKHDLIPQLCEKVKELRKGTNKNEKIDKKLSKIYQNEVFDEVDREFEQSAEFEKVSVGKGAKNAIISKYETMGQLQKEREEEKLKSHQPLRVARPRKSSKQKVDHSQPNQMLKDRLKYLKGSPKAKVPEKVKTAASNEKDKEKEDKEKDSQDKNWRRNSVNQYFRRPAFKKRNSVMNMYDLGGKWGEMSGLLAKEGGGDGKKIENLMEEKKKSNEKGNEIAEYLNKKRNEMKQKENEKLRRRSYNPNPKDRLKANEKKKRRNTIEM